MILFKFRGNIFYFITVSVLKKVRGPFLYNLFYVLFLLLFKFSLLSPPLFLHYVSLYFIAFRKVDSWIALKEKNNNKLLQQPKHISAPKALHNGLFVSDTVINFSHSITQCLHSFIKLQKFKTQWGQRQYRTHISFATFTLIKTQLIFHCTVYVLPDLFSSGFQKRKYKMFILYCLRQDAPLLEIVIMNIQYR